MESGEKNSQKENSRPDDFTVQVSQTSNEEVKPRLHRLLQVFFKKEMSSFLKPE